MIRDDLFYLEQELRQVSQEPKIRYRDRVKEIAFGLTPPWQETPKERTLRLYPRLMPTRAQVEREKRRIGITSFGSPGVKEQITGYLTDFGTWAKAHWQALTLGGGCFALLLVVIARGRKG